MLIPSLFLINSCITAPRRNVDTWFVHIQARLQAGECRAYNLSEHIQAKVQRRRCLPRDFSDYTVTVDDSKVPGVELLRKIG